MCQGRAQTRRHPTSVAMQWAVVPAFRCRLPLRSLSPLRHLGLNRLLKRNAESGTRLELHRTRTATRIAPRGDPYVRLLATSAPGRGVHARVGRAIRTACSARAPSPPIWLAALGPAERVAVRCPTCERCHRHVHQCSKFLLRQISSPAHFAQLRHHVNTMS